MKRNDLVEIKNSKIEDLIKKVISLRKEVADMVIDKNTNKLKDLKSISKKRKDLAQILTIMKQKQLLAEMEKI